MIERKLNSRLTDSRVDSFPSRRKFLYGASLAAASLALSRDESAFAWTAASQSAPAQEPVPDYRIEIAEIEWELAPKKKIRTAAYNGQIPGPLLRVTEGKPVTIEIVNRLGSRGDRALARAMDSRGCGRRDGRRLADDPCGRPRP